MDGIENFVDNMAANRVAVRNEKLKPKEVDPFHNVALEGQNLPESPVVSTMEGKDLSRCVTSSSGFEPRWSANGMRQVVEELKLKRYRKPDSASSQECWQDPDPAVARGFRSKNFRGDSTSLGNDQNLLRVRGELREMSPRVRSLKPLSSNYSEQEADKLSAYLRAEDSKIMSNNMLSIAKKRLKTQSTNSNSQLLVKEMSKGKTISKFPEPYGGFGSQVVGQNDLKPHIGSEVASDAELKANANNDRLSSHVQNQSGTKSISYGISLREWLKPGSHKVDVAERLLIFRQIVELVDFAHSQGVPLQDLRPSRFILLPSNEIKYTGASAIREPISIVNRDLINKRQSEQDVDADAERILGGTQIKMSEGNEDEYFIAGPKKIEFGELQFRMNSSYQNKLVPVQQGSTSVIVQLEEKWYTSPEEFSERGCTLSSNVYALGVLLFELLCLCDSWEVHSALMWDLHDRILPPSFLSQNPLGAGFCLWLLHPEPLSRPTTREILQSELMGGKQESASCDDFSKSADDFDAESEVLLGFLSSLKDKKQGHASKLVEDIRCLEEDINKFGGRSLSGTSSDVSLAHKEFHSDREQVSVSNMIETQLMKNINQLGDAYASTRSQMRLKKTAPVARSDKEVLNNRYSWLHVRNGSQDSSTNQKSGDRLGAFFDGLAKFSRFSKFEVCGTSRNRDLLNSSNVICCLSFDRDEEYIATAGVSKKIKIFDFDSLVDNSLDIHYPVVEMPHKSKLSCVCWNNYFKNYLASSDYDGVVQMWDATTGQGFSQYVEHQRRAWCVEFSQADPKKFASGSDDCTVKLWSTNDKKSTDTIQNAANVCCVQFSACSSNLVVFGSADYKIYGYDLRNTRIPWCTLPGHGKAVSYVKFVDAETLVSASTDNTLKLWDLNQSTSTGLSPNACSLTFSGHTNEKNFVGLSVSDGYIACGSETNEVYSYYRSLPMPITSHKFGSIDPVSGREVGDYSGQFVSSVCWRRKSNILVAANSSGTLKLLQMV
ncbi:protein SUPPRESSOR OF PHYA-105 1 [Pyrus x bretschneideri]|uniref:protein SUPPRESSOR OF PHYA-105 1 n=1 Tax=Pyrus x bretschneideri TaxID=225117 RepID=UPI00202EA503|nr:protein SUPPRESSOR OF PHYA-105 1 [Pyrus x bretschneideri]XP_018507556.2 protein SUPPRESSOR OF PHYA-105 1 [Pyrus x bretschneideri]XP_048422108.1 protein SUPPRESSOR OF PHYA-105 1 [Pyrus x bretschneideri]